MDFIIGGLIMAALIASFKIYKDVSEKKKVNRWFLSIEIILVCTLLWFGISARLTQKEKDATRQKEILDGQRQLNDHMDTGFKNLTDAKRKKITGLEKVIKEQSSVTDNKRQEPEVQVMPYKGELNPVIINFNNDSIHALSFLRNFGPTTAQDIHFQYHFFIRNGVGKGWSASPENDHSCTLIADPEYFCKFELGYKGIPLSTDTVYLSISYCYSDANGKCFGPRTNIYYFVSPFLMTSPSNATSEAYYLIQKQLEEHKMWPIKCF